MSVVIRYASELRGLTRVGCWCKGVVGWLRQGIRIGVGITVGIHAVQISQVDAVHVIVFFLARNFLVEPGESVREGVFHIPKEPASSTNLPARPARPKCRTATPPPAATTYRRPARLSFDNSDTSGGLASSGFSNLPYDDAFGRHIDVYTMLIDFSRPSPEI